MFETLADAIEVTEVPAEGDALVAILGLEDRLHATVLAALGEFDADGRWALEGERSLFGWLRHHADRAPRAAGSLARTARLLRRLPVTAACYGDGRLSGGQLEAIVANLSERTVGRFAEHEAGLLPSLLPLPTADVGTSMRLWRTRAEAELDEKEPPERVREVHLSPSLDRRWHGSLTLDDEGGSLLDTAIRLASSDDAEGEGDAPRSPARRRADALVDIAAFFLDHQQSQPGGRHRPHVNVLIDLGDIGAERPGSLVGGGPLPYDSIETLLCDCNVHRVLVDGGSTILDYGRATKTVPAPLFNALVLRDRHCRHPGCDRPAAFCDAHHIVHWVRGGETNLANLVLKCRRHHRLGHRKRWHETLLADGTLVITEPDGRRMTSTLPGALPMRRAA